MTGDLAGLKRILDQHSLRGTPINQFRCFGGVPMLAVAAHYQQVRRLTELWYTGDGTD